MTSRLFPVIHVSRRKGPKPRGGFTLVEVLIVVVILGILAAIVVPQFVSAASESRDNSIRMDLHRMRLQLELYKEHHNGYPSLANFEAQMTGFTDASGAIVAAGAPGAFGPYIRDVPRNPNTSGNVVDNAAVGDSDWFYDEATGIFKANDSAETFAY
ncbi:MAG: prepilin-type N-terminal cleavage/methylation domain-containing protein [Phycisphaeraceae bacterium]